MYCKILTLTAKLFLYEINYSSNIVLRCIVASSCAMKLYLAVLLLSLCASIFCDYKDCCTIEDRREVQRIWNEIWGAKSSSRRITIAMQTFA